MIHLLIISWSEGIRLLVVWHCTMNDVQLFLAYYLSKKCISIRLFIIHLHLINNNFLLKIFLDSIKVLVNDFAYQFGFICRIGVQLGVGKVTVEFLIATISLPNICLTILLSIYFCKLPTDSCTWQVVSSSPQPFFIGKNGVCWKGIMLSWIISCCENALYKQYN